MLNEEEELLQKEDAENELFESSALVENDIEEEAFAERTVNNYLSISESSLNNLFSGEFSTEDDGSEQQEEIDDIESSESAEFEEDTEEEQLETAGPLAESLEESIQIFNAISIDSENKNIIRFLQNDFQIDEASESFQGEEISYEKMKIENIELIFNSEVRLNKEYEGLRYSLIPYYELKGNKVLNKGKNPKAFLNFSRKASDNYFLEIELLNNAFENTNFNSDTFSDKVKKTYSNIIGVRIILFDSFFIDKSKTTVCCNKLVERDLLNLR